MDELLNQLLGGTSNIYIFNTPVVDEDGRNIVDRSINMNALFVDININELVSYLLVIFAVMYCSSAYTCLSRLYVGTHIVRMGTLFSDCSHCCIHIPPTLLSCWMLQLYSFI